MYSLKKGVFIRYEKDLPGDNVFIFVGSTNEMYQANKEVYDVIELIKKNTPFEEIVEELNIIYKDSNQSEILSKLQQILDYLVEVGVLEVV